MIENNNIIFEDHKYLIVDQQEIRNIKVFECQDFNDCDISVYFTIQNNKTYKISYDRYWFLYYFDENIEVKYLMYLKREKLEILKRIRNQKYKTKYDLEWLEERFKDIKILIEKQKLLI